MNKYSIIVSLLFVLTSVSTFAQAPEHINYQAALRNSQTGVELSNQEVFLVVKFLDGGPGGSIVYQEEHSEVTSSLYGIINIKLGDGNPVQGEFHEIPWSSGDIWLDLEGDVGNGLEPIGISKFSSVPYALYAADAPAAEPDGDGDSTNEIQDLTFSNHILSISKNNNAATVDMSGYINAPDDDSDPSNEIQDLNLSNDTLTILGNPNPTKIDLTPYINIPDADSDPNNELITAFDYNPLTSIISITEAGDTLSLDLSPLAGGGGPDADADPQNEIQDLNLSNDTLTITNNDFATKIDLTNYRNVPNLDNDPANEIQDLNLSNDTLTITNNDFATKIDLTNYRNVPNLDNDSANEIQDLNLSNDTLTITNNDFATKIDLTNYRNVPNLDNDPANEIQDLNLSNDTLTITGNGSATSINLINYRNVPNLDNDPANEIQDLNLSNDTLIITGNGSATSINLINYRNVPNLDNDPANEIQDLNLSNDTLMITGNGSATPINLIDYKNIPNLDNDPANEIQDLQLSGNTLTITGNLSANEIDLNNVVENSTLASGNIYIGDSGDNPSSQDVSGDVRLYLDGSTTVRGIQDIPVSTTAPTDGQMLVYNSGTNMWIPTTSATPTVTTKYYSVDPMDFVELTDVENGVELDEHNAIKFYNKNAPFAMIYKSDINQLGAPVHLPHGATITSVKFFIRDNGMGAMMLSLERKKLDDYSTTNTAISSGSTTATFGNSTFTLAVNGNNVVDNNLYSYRVFVSIPDDEQDKAEPIANIQQVVYGVVIAYE